MDYYQTDPDTGELLSAEPIEALPCPRTEGEWLFPGGAVLDAPPTADPGHVVRWTGAAWDTPEDHRGRQGWVDGSPVVVTALGPLPEGWSETPPAPEVPLVPGHVWPRQLRLALLGLGITPAMIEAQLAGNDAALIEWHYASVIDRAHPLVASLAAAMDLDEAEVDALFVAAAGM